MFFKMLILLLLVFPSWAYSSEQKEITISLPGGESMEFVRIEPGTFLMGTSEKWKEKWDKFNSAYVTSNIRIPYTNEFPQHKVTITKGFYLGKYEVSIGQWIALMDLPEDRRPPRLIRSGMTQITWFEIQDWLAVLSEQSGLTFRLPTEAEWEYTARAGTTTLWWFGDDRKEAEDILDGSAPPNPWGLHNMLGGVWEFTDDTMRKYYSQHEIDPVGPRRPWPGKTVVIRGGDNGAWQSLVEWPTFPWYSRCAWRGIWYTDRPTLSFGFRVLLEEDALTGIVGNKSWGEVKKKIEGNK